MPSSYQLLDSADLQDAIPLQTLESDPLTLKTSLDSLALDSLSEKTLSEWEALLIYKKAVIFSVVLSTAVIMEGYDLVLLGNLYAMPVFNAKYGVLGADGTYQIPAAWQAALSTGVATGGILGLFVNGIASERFGYKKTMLVSLFAMIGFIFIPFTAQSLFTLLVGEILCGIPWGVFQTLTTAYASEVCPVQLRGYLTTYVNLCWVIGQIIGAGVLRLMLERNDEWAYRIPFAIQWLWPVPIIIGTMLAPESPWWLVRQGRYDDAKAALHRLTSVDYPETKINDSLLDMIQTNKLEKSRESGVGYLDCFKGIDRRRTLIVCMTWSIQSLCGSAFMSYSTYFYEQAGLSTSYAFDFSMIQYALGFIGTVGSWFLMGYLGRRTIYCYGLFGLTILLLCIGFVSISGFSNAGLIIGSLLLIYTFAYDLSIGPICYSLVAEIPSTRLKTKSIVLARNTYNAVGIVNSIITPYMLNPTALNWKGRTGFFWA
ncbi:hypothetical protein HK096_005269, partial [Nowakowskiella sp. JEL0078]